MTDLERDASEIVRGILDAAAVAAGYKDYLDATSTGLMAAANPAVVSALVARIRELESEVREIGRHLQDVTTEP